MAISQQTGPYSLMYIEEAAELLRTPVSTLRFWRHSGAGPKSARVGGRVMYRQKDIEDWINEQFEKENN